MTEGPRLVRDYPEWMMPGINGESSPRRLRLFTDREGGSWAVVTERGPGRSITNVAEFAYALLKRQIPGARVVEHYPPRCGHIENLIAEYSQSTTETFDEITLQPDGQPSWRRISPTEMVSILGQKVLDDMPNLPPDPDVGEYQLQRDLESRQHVYTGPELTDKAFFLGRSATETVTMHSPDGDEIGVVEHYIKHSPAGFSWGYGGSGPAELARCILIIVLGETARCLDCAGTTEIVVNAEGSVKPFRQGLDNQDGWSRCFSCDCGNSKVGDLYQSFKNEYVATWPQDKDWKITVGKVRKWIAQQDSRY